MSEQYSLSADVHGIINVGGELTFNTVNELLTKAPILFKKHDKLEINLLDVTRSDSAGLALLVDWMRYAKRSNKTIAFHNLPSQMLAIANASGFDELLPIN